MYNLVKSDGINPESISDSIYHTSSENVRVLYTYAGSDPVGPAPDEKNQKIEDGNAVDAANANLNYDPANSAGHKAYVQPKMVEHTINQEDLDKNPDLVEENLQVGDVVEVSEEANESGDLGSAKLVYKAQRNEPEQESK